MVESLQSLKYKVFAAGDSYNDIQMLAAADFGVFFQAPQHIRDEFSSFPGVQSHEELKELCTLISNNERQGISIDTSNP